jgi:hypothetical protein
MIKAIKYINYDHVWFIQYNKYIKKKLTLLKALKFKNATLFFTYFYFLSKDHQFAYFNMFMPLAKLNTCVVSICDPIIFNIYLARKLTFRNWDS